MGISESKPAKFDIIVVKCPLHNLVVLFFPFSPHFHLKIPDFESPLLLGRKTSSNFVLFLKRKRPDCRQCFSEIFDIEKQKIDA